MIKAHYKLVRDKIPDLIKKSGSKAIVKKIKKNGTLFGKSQMKKKML